MSPFSAHAARRAARIAEEALSLLLAASCAGCDAPGVMLCPSCRAQLAPAPVRRPLAGGAHARAALTFDGVVARSIRAVKEEGATHLARPLGTALRAVLPTGVDVVPVPTTRAAFRRRGFRVPELLLRRAGHAPVKALAAVGRPLDQRGLSRAQRAENVAGSLRARRPGRGREVIVMDDVITTGATLSEAVRVLESAGFAVVGAVALAATPLRTEGGIDTTEMVGDIRVNEDYGRASQGGHGPPPTG